jgi:hypothetical protein
MGADGHVRDRAREIYGDNVIDAGLERIAETAQALLLPLFVHHVDLLVHSQQWSQAAFLVGTHVPQGVLDVIASGPVPGCSDECDRFSAVLRDALNNVALGHDGEEDAWMDRARLHAELCDVEMHFTAEEVSEEEERPEIAEEDVDEEATAMQQDAMAAARERALQGGKDTAPKRIHRKGGFGFVPRR